MEERCLDNGMCMYIIVYICIYYITIIKVHHYIMEYIYIYTPFRYYSVLGFPCGLNQNKADILGVGVQLASSC